MRISAYTSGRCVVLSHVHAQDDPLNPGQESLPSRVYIVLRRIFNVYMLPARLWKCVGGLTATELVLDRTADLELRIVAVTPCRIAEYFLSLAVDWWAFFIPKIGSATSR